MTIDFNNGHLCNHAGRQTYTKWQIYKKQNKIKRSKLLKVRFKKVKIEDLVSNILNLTESTIERYGYFEFSAEALSEYLKVSIKDIHRALLKIKVTKGLCMFETNNAVYDSKREYYGTGGDLGGWKPTYYKIIKKEQTT
jgi:hypothetical protein